MGVEDRRYHEISGDLRYLTREMAEMKRMISDIYMMSRHPMYMSDGGPITRAMAEAPVYRMPEDIQREITSIFTGGSQNTEWDANANR